MFTIKNRMLTSAQIQVEDNKAAREAVRPIELATDID